MRLTTIRREIGLRIALGAESGDVIWLVSKRVIPTLAVGILTGAGLSYFAGIWVRSLLYGVQPFDPRSIGLALLLVIAIAIGASAAPAIRAMRVDENDLVRQQRRNASRLDQAPSLCLDMRIRRGR